MLNTSLIKPEVTSKQLNKAVNKRWKRNARVKVNSEQQHPAVRLHVQQKRLKGTFTNCRQLSVFAGLTKPFVAPDEATYNLTKCL